MDSIVTTPRAERRFVMPDGVTLVADAWGDERDRPVILLHGGGQTRHAWKRTGEALAAEGWFALAVDQRGHGASGWSPDGDYAIERFAGDVRAVAAALPRRPAVVGASLGGIAALIAEGEMRPSFAAGLVLVDITPRVEASGVARIRAFMRAHAAEGFPSVEAAADAVAAYLPHRPRPKDTRGLRKNLRLDPDGRWRWHWDPAFIDNYAARFERDRTERLAAAARGLAVPVRLVRGAASELVTEAAAREFLELAPQADHVDVSGAAHMVAGDRNDAFTDAVVSFLRKL
jgi:pimeloyl-ACP methyl ester carboxylesterase